MLRPLFLSSLVAGAFVTIAVACTDASTTAAPSDDAGTTADGASRKDGAATEPDEDGSTSPPKDAGTDAKQAKDANGPGEAGAECQFNRDCQAALRCECDESTGCACQPGARGAGQNGIDACDSGNQCASSVCVEGPTNGEFVCSDECESAQDCTGKLPRCIPVFGFDVPICVRIP